jgi:hypothetical protein
MRGAPRDLEQVNWATVRLRSFPIKPANSVPRQKAFYGSPADNQPQAVRRQFNAQEYKLYDGSEFGRLHLGHSHGRALSLRGKLIQALVVTAKPQQARSYEFFIREKIDNSSANKFLNFVLVNAQCLSTTAAGKLESGYIHFSGSAPG